MPKKAGSKSKNKRVGKSESTLVSVAIAKPVATAGTQGSKKEALQIPKQILRMAELVKIRREFIRTNFESPESLAAYISKRSNSKRVLKKIQDAVSAKSFVLDQLVRSKKLSAKDRKEVVASYVGLVNTSNVDVSKVFSEVPEDFTLCDYCELTQYKSKGHPQIDAQTQTMIAEQLSVRMTDLNNKYKMITGRELPMKAGWPDFQKWPHIEELERFIMPVPYSTKWSPELLKAEAVALGREPLEYSEQASTITDAALVSSSASSEPCDLRAIYEMAGGAFPNQPTDGRRYTFPGNKLMSELPVFYDFSVMVPCEECAVASDATQVHDRDLLAAKALASLGLTVISFIESNSLSAAFGVEYQTNQSGDVVTVPFVTQKIKEQMDKVIDLLNSAVPSDIQKIQRTLKQLAGVVRQIARTQLVIPRTDNNALLNIASQVENAANAIAFSIEKRSMPEHDPNRTKQYVQSEGAWREAIIFGQDELRLDAKADSWGGHANSSKGFYYPNYNAKAAGAENPGKAWQWDYLTPYLAFLGEVFAPQVKLLQDTARALAISIQTPGSMTQNYSEDLRNILAGLLNESAFALSRIMEQICELLTPKQKIPDEGTKRLAVQVIFRQYWWPEGYVQGKLVGYKNLTPNQKEEVKRRTFIKTTREVATAEEFTSSRQNDYSRSQKESLDVLKEAGHSFNLTTNASGGFDIGLASGDSSVGTNTTLSGASKTAHNRMAEVTTKGSSSFNNKREVKIKELTEYEDVQEVKTEMQNANQEITANYFYYQLLRQYYVTSELYNIRPVLLRTREVPEPAEIDDKFISKYAHILIHCLPSQLSVDAQEVADRIDSLSRALILSRVNMQRRNSEYEAFRTTFDGGSSDEEKARWREELASRERSVTEARSAYQESEDEYLRAQARLDRVVSHLRENIRYYMQFIWHESPKVDQDYLLQDESFGGIPLPQVTRGLMRIGYFGNEEVFNYTGPSVTQLSLLLDNLKPGSELADLTDDEIKQTSLYRYLEMTYAGSEETLLERIRNSAFPIDPLGSDEVLDAQRIQVVQDALVVEAMPGQVPLLEGFQMAHRALDVQKACLENQHLKERIADRPWKTSGKDDYEVLRANGTPVNVEKS